MKRVIYVNNGFDDMKFELCEEYRGFGIYQERTPSGFLVHQSWAIAPGVDDLPILIESFNNLSKAELLDAIDSYLNGFNFGFNVFYKPYAVVVHGNGNNGI